MEPTQESPLANEALLTPAPAKTSRLPFFILGVVVLLLILGASYFLISSASVPKKLYHVGVLSGLDFFYDSYNGFKKGMTDLGYIEGKNIVYDLYKAPASVGNQVALQKFVDDKDDLILAFPTEASLEAKEAVKGTNIPVISLNAVLEGNGLVDSVQAPGGNLTGVRFPETEIVNKRFEVARQLFPNAKRYWVPYLKDYPSVVPGFEKLDPLAKAAGITIIKAPFESPDAIIAYLAAQKPSEHLGADIIFSIPEPIGVIPTSGDAIVAFAHAAKMPMAGFPFLTEKDFGNIFTLIPNAFHVGELSAPLADKIFHGIAVGTIPIMTPESDLEINYKAAQALGVTVPESLLSTATRVVK